MRSIKPTTIRLSEEDLELVEKVKRRYGQSSLIGSLRTALRIASGEGTEQTIHKTITKSANNPLNSPNKKDALERPNAGAGEED